MCGVTALFSRTHLDPDADVRAVLRAGESMSRRGPDGQGVWSDPGVVLGHRRLSILDLDSRASQPMISDCGRYAIVFNGEIYNFAALRGELEQQGCVFRTTSDTEVILALFARDGEAMLPWLHGMFALIIWDRSTKRALVARDPYGIKPLYVSAGPFGVAVASQVRALIATGLVSREPDPKGQAGFWMLGSVPEPFTWYRHISPIRPGHLAWIEDGRLGEQRSWLDVADAWRGDSAEERPNGLADRVKAALRESVSRHMVADVPVGVFLSGGIDSGALAGMVAERAGRRVSGITITYDEFAGTHEDEAPVAAQIANQFGIDHHIRRVTRNEFLEDLPRIFRAMDQPTIDGVNTWYASKAAAEIGLKVVLSGVGGDELFYGYESFRQLPALVTSWNRVRHIPGAGGSARLAASLAANRSGNARWRRAPEWLQTISGAWWLRRGLFPPDELPTVMDNELVAGQLADFDPVDWLARSVGPLSNDNRIALAHIESLTYLRNQLLRDSDWASMDHSVELRTPLVDAHLLETLTPDMRLLSRQGSKRLLAQAPELPLAESVIGRRKTGFGIPIDLWLQTGGSAEGRGLKGWARRVAAAYDTN